MSDENASSASKEQVADSAGGTGNITQEVVGSPNVDPESDLRVRRIREQVGDALREPDPLQANIGAACGEIFFLHRRLFQMLAPALSEGDDPKANLDEMKSAIEMYLKLGNQGSQYANLGQKYRKSTKGA